jgi:hypothetical protein
MMRAISLATILVSAIAWAAPKSETRNMGTIPPAFTMPLGADDAGNKRQVFADPALAEAFEMMGFDFLMVHIWRGNGPGTKQSLPYIAAMNKWAAETGHDYIINQENSSRQKGSHPDFQRPGFFFQPTPDWLAACLSSPHFKGVCYDEAEHWTTNGVDVTGGARAEDEFRPHFFNAEGLTLAAAYEGNLHNLGVLREKQFAFGPASWRTLDKPMLRTEHVFPSLFPMFGRAGMAPHPKFLKESVLPVAAAVALGACLQYEVPYVPCLDLWGVRAPRGSRKEWPYHTPEELQSSLLFSYWTGAHAAYIENINYQDSLYRVVDGKPELTAWGKVAQSFQREYMPQHPRRVLAQHLKPSIAIVRFPDSDWGQVKRGHIRQNLYGASNLVPDGTTRAWSRVWRLLTHDVLPGTGLTWHADGFGMNYRLFIPANNVVVYDHLAADPKLYEGLQLAFLLGTQIPEKTMRTVEAFVRNGGVAATVPRLAPAGIRKQFKKGTTTVPEGRGKWVLFTDAADPALKQTLAPYLGSPDELRYRFGETEIIFTAPKDFGQLEVQVRRARR